MSRGCEYQRLIAGLVIAGSCRAGAGLRNHRAPTIHETHYGRFAKNVLIVSCKEEDPVASQWPSNGEAKLVLLAGGLDVHDRAAGVECAVAEVIESAAVKFIGA